MALVGMLLLLLLVAVSGQAVVGQQDVERRSRHVSCEGGRESRCRRSHGKSQSAFMPNSSGAAQRLCLAAKSLPKRQPPAGSVQMRNASSWWGSAMTMGDSKMSHANASSRNPVLHAPTGTCGVDLRGAAAIPTCMYSHWQPYSHPLNHTFPASEVSVSQSVSATWTDPAPHSLSKQPSLPAKLQGYLSLVRYYCCCCCACPPCCACSCSSTISCAASRMRSSISAEASRTTLARGSGMAAAARWASWMGAPAGAGGAGQGRRGIWQGGEQGQRSEVHA